jgi:UDP-N-acetylglucosamine 2-epimerase (non-hydrolysing)/UDP-GlcNAc3NAcA epimerase
VSRALKIVHIVGSRPQFPKMAAVSRAVQLHNQAAATPIEERVVHTGQHYDHQLSRIFFEELQIRAPDYHLDVGSGDHAFQTARTLEGVHAVLNEWPPDAVLVYGDTNATLAGALATLQSRVQLAHVEAGVRTGNLFQAEELNRVVADRICRWRYCCTQHGVRTLEGEGLGEGSVFTGDTMLDNYRYLLPQMHEQVPEELGLDDHGYILCTVHRAENTDVPERLRAILDAIVRVQLEIQPVVFPMHPRTQKAIEQLNLTGKLEGAGVRVIESQGFLAVQALLEHSHCVLSDSGGLQREAYFSGRRCVVPWEYASWIELAQTGWALTGPVDPEQLVARVASAPGPQEPEPQGLFGRGDAGKRIVGALLNAFGR